MERRVLLAIFLSFIVLYVYQALFVKPVPKPGTAPVGSAAKPAPTPAALPAAPVEPEPAAAAAAPATPLVAEGS
jgi:hypothetical protein